MYTLESKRFKKKFERSSSDSTIEIRKQFVGGKKDFWLKTKESPLSISSSNGHQGLIS